MILTFQVKSFHVYPHTIAFLGTFVAPVFGTFVEAEQVIGAFYNSFYDVDVGRYFIFGTIQGSSCDR
jgi:hypothetical protein